MSNYIIAYHGGKNLRVLKREVHKWRNRKHGSQTWAML